MSINTCASAGIFEAAFSADGMRMRHSRREGEKQGSCRRAECRGQHRPSGLEDLLLLKLHGDEKGEGYRNMHTDAKLFADSQ